MPRKKVKEILSKSVIRWVRLSATNKQAVECVTIGGLASLSGKSPITLKKWEEKGWLPIPNFRMPSQEIGGETREGERLYTRVYAEKMAESIKRVKRGEQDKTVLDKVRHELYILNKEERDIYLN